MPSIPELSPVEALIETHDESRAINIADYLIRAVDKNIRFDEGRSNDHQATLWYQGILGGPRKVELHDVGPGIVSIRGPPALKTYIQSLENIEGFTVTYNGKKQTVYDNGVAKLDLVHAA